MANKNIDNYKDEFVEIASELAEMGMSDDEISKYFEQITLKIAKEQENQLRKKIVNKYSKKLIKQQISITEFEKKCVDGIMDELRKASHAEARKNLPALRKKMAVNKRSESN